MRPRTREEALDQCQRLWEELARTGSRDKAGTVRVVLGYRPRSNCPACEWDEQGRDEIICLNCPVKAWRRVDSRDLPNKCCDPDSPYWCWGDAQDCDERQYFARKILELVEESRDETTQ